MTYLILFLLFILPFIVNPLAGAYFEPPKVILAEVVIEMLMVCWLLSSKIKLKSKFLLPLAILFGVSLLDLLIFPSSIGLFGNQFRLQGTFLLWHLLIFSFIASYFEIKIPRLLIYLSFPALLLVTLLMGGQSTGRAVGTLGEPNALAAVAVFLWPFSLLKLVMLKKWAWLPIILSLGIAAVVVFYSGSRSGLVALIIQVVFLAAFKMSQNLKLALILGLILFLASLSLPFFAINQGFKFEDRLEVWRVSLNAGFKSPLIGQGFGNTENAIKASSKALNSDLQYQYVDSAHNLFLDYWIEGGLIGLGVLVFLLTTSFRNFLLQKKILELTLLLGVITALSFNPASVVSLLALWWLISQGFLSHS